MVTYPDQVRAAERAALRKRRRRRGNQPGIATLRAAELNRLFDHRYGATLPDDDAGRSDVRLMVHTLARRSDPIERIEAWLAARAPWFVGEERVALTLAALEHPLRWRADTLGKLLGLTEDERGLLKIRTIGPIGSTAVERARARQVADVERKQQARRAAGIKPRAPRDFNSLNATSPWKAAGVARSTWFRRRALGRIRTSNGAV